MKYALILCVVLVGCATPDLPPDARYLTKENDDWMRENCEPYGCAIVPMPEFQGLLERLWRYERAA